MNFVKYLFSFVWNNPVGCELNLVFISSTLLWVHSLAHVNPHIVLASHSLSYSSLCCQVTYPLVKSSTHLSTYSPTCQLTQHPLVNYPHLLTYPLTCQPTYPLVSSTTNQPASPNSLTCLVSPALLWTHTISCEKLPLLLISCILNIVISWSLP